MYEHVLTDAPATFLPLAMMESAVLYAPAKYAFFLESRYKAATLESLLAQRTITLPLLMLAPATNVY